MRNRAMFLIVPLIVLCLIMVAGLGKANAQEGKKPAVLLIARGETSVQQIGIDGFQMMIQKEVIPIVNKLNEAGYVVDIASESGAAIKAGRSELSVSKKLADVDIQDYVGVIVPCMGEKQGAVPQKSVEIIKSAYNNNMPLAAQQSGVELLGAAGVLDGKDFAVAEYLKWFIKGGIFKGTGVVQDGNIVTSGTCPYMAIGTGEKDGTDELVSTFIRLLKK